LTAQNTSNVNWFSNGARCNPCHVWG